MAKLRDALRDLYSESDSLCRRVRALTEMFEHTCRVMSLDGPILAKEAPGLETSSPAAKEHRAIREKQE